MLAIYFWRGGERNKAYATSIAAIAIAAIALSTSNTGPHTTASNSAPSQTTTTPERTTAQTTTATETQTPAAPTTTTGPTDPTMGVRTRVFITKLRLCQKAVRALRTALAVADQLQPAQLATVAEGSKTVCTDVRAQMATYNTQHFDQQAITADLAVDDYKTFIDNVIRYIDTQTPSDIPKAQQVLASATTEAADAVNTINMRRQLYGFNNI